MSLGKIQLVYELLTEQLNHWMLFPVALTMMEMTRGQTGMQTPDLLLWTLCGLFPPLFFGLRLYCLKQGRKKFFLILCHIGTAAVYTLLLLIPPRPFVCRNICILCGAGYMLYSLMLQLKKDTPHTVAMQLPAAVALSLASTFMRHTNQWNRYYTLSLIAVTALFFMVFYLRQYLDFMSLNKGSTGHMPAGDIFRSGTGLAAGYTLLGTGILIFSTQYQWLAGLLEPVMDFLMGLLRGLLSKLPKPKSESGLPVPEEGISLEKLPSVERTQPLLLWKILQIAFTVILAGALVFLIVRLLLKLLRILQDYLNRRLARQETSQEEIFDVREKCGVEKSAGKTNRERSAAFTNREKVRKLYKRKLQDSPFGKGKSSRKNILGLRTAREWESLLETRGMADIYEKTRYTLEEITAEDVRKMKEACK